MEICFTLMHYFKSTYDITSRLRYRLFGILSDIRWVVHNVFVSRRMDTQNKYKARLAPKSLRYFKNTPMHLCNTNLQSGNVNLTPMNSSMIVNADDRPSPAFALKRVDLKKSPSQKSRKTLWLLFMRTRGHCKSEQILLMSLKPLRRLEFLP